MGEHDTQHVVVVGAGFGGLWAIRALATARLDVVLIDRNNYHTFQPLLYQVAAAELSPEEIAFPARAFLRRFPRVGFLMAEVLSIDCVARAVHTDAGPVPYDYLILAPGSRSHFFGVPGADQYAFCLKSLDEAVALRNHILYCFESAAHEADPARRRQLLTFAVVGGGAMGVEFAGALAELVYGPLRKDYPALDFGEVQVLLIEAMGGLLLDLPERLREHAFQRLDRMGVRIRLNAPVERLSREGIYLRGDEAIATVTAVWTAGVRGTDLARTSGLPTDRQGRLLVRPSLQLAEHPEVFVVGDLAHVEADGQPLPMVAPVAIQEGSHAAGNVIRASAGRPLEDFHYRDVGRMATIGRNAAVAQLMGRTFVGLFAWLLWLVVHLMNLIGFRNRLIVVINWAWDYLFMERVVRLILPSVTHPPSQS